MASTAESSELELADRGEGAQQHVSLPPVDGGKDAWLFLAASFVVEALVWGMCDCVSACILDSTSLTNGRFPIFIRRVPGVLFDPRAFRRGQQYRGHRHLCYGTSCADA